MDVSAFDIAQRFVGVRETSGEMSNAQVLAMLRLDAGWVENDETPWCSAFANYVAWVLRLPRSKSLAARSWLEVGEPIDLKDARIGYDVVVYWRGAPPQPGPDVIRAPGHVGFFAKWDRDTGQIWTLGGNQSDSVCLRPYDEERLLGVRRLY